MHAAIRYCPLLSVIVSYCYVFVWCYPLSSANVKVNFGIHYVNIRWCQLFLRYSNVIITISSSIVRHLYAIHTIFHVIVGHDTLKKRGGATRSSHLFGGRSAADVRNRYDLMRGSRIRHSVNGPISSLQSFILYSIFAKEILLKPKIKSCESI